jgi:hypothetical protein
MTTLNPQDPKPYILAHDKRVVQLDRMSVPMLRREYNAALEGTGHALLYGGPVDKDEWVSAVIEIEFPDITAAREAYVQMMAG